MPVSVACLYCCCLHEPTFRVNSSPCRSLSPLAGRLVGRTLWGRECPPIAKMVHNKIRCESTLRVCASSPVGSRCPARLQLSSTQPVLRLLGRAVQRKRRACSLYVERACVGRESLSGELTPLPAFGLTMFPPCCRRALRSYRVCLSGAGRGGGGPRAAPKGQRCDPRGEGAEGRAPSPEGRSHREFPVSRKRCFLSATAATAMYPCIGACCSREPSDFYCRPHRKGPKLARVFLSFTIAFPRSASLAVTRFSCGSCAPLTGAVCLSLSTF